MTRLQPRRGRLLSHVIEREYDAEYRCSPSSGLEHPSSREEPPPSYAPLHSHTPRFPEGPSLSRTSCATASPLRGNSV
jgi:hypothetical protein